MLKGNYFVYITTNPGETVLYTKVTNNLTTQIRQHYEARGKPNNFAGKFFCYRLIYFERYSDINFAIEREKEIKSLSRELKEELINSLNPKWNFLVAD